MYISICHGAGAQVPAAVAPGSRRLKQAVTRDPGYVKLGSDYSDPAIAFANALVGGIDGLTVASASYNGWPSSSALIQLSTDHELYSTFTSTNGNKGLTVVLTSGSATFAAIVTGPGATSSVATSNTGSSLITSSRDASTLAMRLTASKSLSFTLEYVYATDDVGYPDAFVMFVGKNGAAAYNVALLPTSATGSRVISGSNLNSNSQARDVNAVKRCVQ
jgi:hypothetical protein